MPDVSIAISAKDGYSAAISKMAQITKSFNKDAEHMEGVLHQLDTQRTTLKMDAGSALSELRRLQKQYAETGSEADGLKVQMAQVNYDNIKRNMDLVSKGMKEAERQMQQTGEAFRRTSNQMGGSGAGGIKNLLSVMAAGGIAQMAQGTITNISNALVSSAGGDEMGQMFSNALSLGIDGAELGFTVASTLASTGGTLGGPAGAAIGGAIGAGLGLVNGAISVIGQRDDSFQGYVQEQYTSVTEEQAASLESGSGIAAQRESDLISFSTLFQDRGTAEEYLAGLTDMANRTPFLYGDLTAMSKTLATYGYNADSILPVLSTIGDTGAALGMNTSDMTMLATALGRMKSSDKASLEYLNILNDRGVGAVGILADSYGVDEGTMYDMISKGEISGREASELILTSLTDSFSGSMEAQSKTFSGLVSTREGLQQEMDNAMGQGYNEMRKDGHEDEIEWLSGDSGAEMQEAYSAIGAWKANLENLKEQYVRNSIDDAMESDEYQTAKSENNAAEMGRLIMAAKARGMNEYNAGPGAQEALESERSLAETIRDDASLKSGYYDAGIVMGDQFSTGLAASALKRISALQPSATQLGSGITPPTGVTVPSSGIASGSTTGITPGTQLGSGRVSGNSPSVSGYAWGLPRVPYDNFPALLHQGERVLTASEARSADRSGGEVQVTFTGPVTVREEADLDRLARKFAAEVKRASLLAAPL